MIASATEGLWPHCKATEHMETLIVKGKIRCGACHRVSPHTEWGVTKAAPFPKEARFHQPENIDLIKELSTEDFRVSAGGNDWEDTWIGVSFTFGGDSNYGYKNRVWGNLSAPEHLTSGEASNVPKEKRHWGKRVVRNGIAAADDKRQVLSPEVGKESWKPEHFMAAAKEPDLSKLVKERGEDVMV
jgi:hypothetical protein